MRSSARASDKGEYEILTGTPYPEGTFGEEEPVHKLYRFPLIGAACGFTVGLLLTTATQLAFPLVAGGKPLLSIPPMAIIMYEGTMLGAILFTVVGIIFESRLPRIFMGAYDTRITEGYIGITITADESRWDMPRRRCKRPAPRKSSAAGSRPISNHYDCGTTR